MAIIYTVNKLLHIGCGLPGKAIMHKAYMGKDWQTIRIDNFTDAKPDIKTDLHNLKPLDSNKYNAIWLPHALSRLEAHQLSKAFMEYYRVLKIGGKVEILQYDNQSLAEYMAEGRLEGTVKLNNVDTPIIDLVYGNRDAIKQGYEHLKTRTAFNCATLGKRLVEAKFSDIIVKRDGLYLHASATKLAKPNGKVQVLGNDINKIIAERDKLDRPTNLPVEY